MQRLIALVAPLSVAGLVLRQQEEPASCGAVAVVSNARPKEFADRKKTAWNDQEGKTLPVTYSAGDNITFECMPGFTLDGSKDGATDFKVECTQYGYYKPFGTCIEASKCGAIPTLAYALPTGKVDKKTGKEVVEYACQPGYSLDGEKVVAGGLGKNVYFTVECIEFSHTYGEPTGECKAADFVPLAAATAMYKKVFEALFHVSCKGKIQTHFSMENTDILSNSDKVCGGVTDKALCATVLSDLKTEFDAALAKRADEKNLDKNWKERTDLTNVDDEADKFCKKLWGSISAR